jgi:hypothetical protein
MRKKTFLNLMMVGLAAALWSRAELQAQTWENITTNVTVTLHGDASYAE